MKRILAVFLSLCMICAMLGTLQVSAAGDAPFVRDFSSYPNQRTFWVENQQDLEMLATLVNGGNTLSGYTFLQTADIVLTGGFTPIGANPDNIPVSKLTDFKPFRGTYDGQYHTISNLNIDLPEQNGVGLFGSCYGATLKNIGIESGSVVGLNRAGGIAGYADNCKVQNCYNKASVQAVSAADGVGGIAGVSRNRAELTGCINLGSVTGSKAGGISGWSADVGTIRACYNGGKVSLSDGTESGTSVDAISRNSNTASMDYSENYYLLGSCAINCWGAIEVGTEIPGQASWLINQKLDANVYTVTDSGDLAFSGQGRDGIVCITLRLYGSGMLLREETQYLAGGTSYTVPETLDGHTVQNAVVSGTTYQPGSVIPVENSDFVLELYLAGALPSATQVAQYPNDTHFTVSTADELASVATLVNNGTSFENKILHVIQDLNFSGKSSWTPVGNSSSHPFRGTLDGHNHHFRNISTSIAISNNSYPALFGNVNGGTLENIILDKGTVTTTTGFLASGNTGGLLCYELSGGGTICYIENHCSLNIQSSSIISRTATNVGLVSKVADGTVKSIFSDGAVTVGTVGSGVGAIVGTMDAQAIVSNCISAAAVNNDTAARSFVGDNSGDLRYSHIVDDADITAAELSSARTAYLMNTAFGSQENSGVWTNGPTLAPEQAVYRVSAVLLDERGEQFGEEQFYYAKDAAVAAPRKNGYQLDRAVWEGETLSAGWLMPAKDVAIFYHYTRETYPVAYTLNGGTLQGEAPTSHTAGERVILPGGDQAVREGFGFLGWYDNANLSGTVYREIPADRTGALTFYAAWGRTAEISSPAQLAALDMNGSYILTADIDMTGTAFSPIGTKNKPFTGYFDGNGYIISGLNIQSDGEYQGLFGYNLGTIVHVTLAEDCVISGSAIAGGIAGFNGGTVADSISRAAVSNTDTAPASYKIMSQNLYISGEGEFSLTARQPRMLARINREQPDLIGMQEGNAGWMTYLRANLTEYTLLYQDRNGTSEEIGEGTPVAFRTDRFELLDSSTFWLSTSPAIPAVSKQWSASHARVCTWVILKDKTTGQLIGLYNTHLDVGSATARLEGAKQIKARMEQTLKEYPGIMLFSTGDYNTYEKSAPYNVLTSDGLGDARYLAKVSDEKPTYSGVQTDEWVNDTGAKTIDFIVTYQANVEVETFRVLSETVDGYRASDHNGVLADFHAPADSAFGGVAGVNQGTVRRVLSPAEEPMLGRDTGTTADLYDAAALNGLDLSDPEFPWKLNQTAGYKAFTVENGTIAVTGDRGVPIPVRLLVNNGKALYVLSGSDVRLDTTGFTDPVCSLNGVYFEGTTLIAPEEDGVVAIVENVDCAEHNYNQCIKEDENFHRWICANNPTHTMLEPHRFTTDSSGGRSCAACGYTQEASTHALPKIAAVSLTLYNDLAVNFKINNSLLDSFTDLRMEFRLGEKSATVPLSEATASAGNRLAFEFRGIDPHEMDDYIVVTLYGTAKDDGQEYSSAVVYSVTTYCLNKLGGIRQKNELGTLLVDLLNYGKEAYDYMNEGDTSNPIAEILTGLGEKADWGSSGPLNLKNILDTGGDANTAREVQWTYIGLNLSSTTTVRVRVTVPGGDPTGLSLRGTSRYGTSTITKFIPVEGETDQFYAELPGLGATQLNEKLILRIYRGTQQVSTDCIFSVASYAYAIRAGQKDPAYQKAWPLVEALMRYGGAAEAYDASRSDWSSPGVELDGENETDESFN